MHIYKGSIFKAEIKKDSKVGYYLYIYDIKTGRCVADYLQDSLDAAIEQAEDEFNIPKELWREI